MCSTHDVSHEKGMWGKEPEDSYSDEKENNWSSCEKDYINASNSPSVNNHRDFNNFVKSASGFREQQHCNQAFRSRRHDYGGINTTMPSCNEFFISKNTHTQGVPSYRNVCRDLDGAHLDAFRERHSGDKCGCKARSHRDNPVFSSDSFATKTSSSSGNVGSNHVKSYGSSHQQMNSEDKIDAEEISKTFESQAVHNRTKFSKSNVKFPGSATMDDSTLKHDVTKNSNQSKLSGREKEKTVKDGNSNEDSNAGLKNVRKEPKRTNRGRRRHGLPKKHTLRQENIQDNSGYDIDWARFWLALVNGLFKKAIFQIFLVLPVCIAALHAVLWYILLLGVLSVFPIICCVWTCLKWLPIFILSKIKSCRDDFNAFWRKRNGEQSVRHCASVPLKPYHEPGLGGDAIVSKLLASKDKDAYGVLGVSDSATDDDIKRRYREMAKIVHPDKNPHPDAGEAFQILQSAFESISDEEQFEDFMGKMKEHINELRNKIMCSVCNKPHPRCPTDRAVSAARYCSQCNVRHSAKEGDVWVETSHMGFKYYCYLCTDDEVFEVTEWGSCQDLLTRIPANYHTVLLSVKPRGRPSSSPWDDLFGGSEHQSRPNDSKKKRHKSRAKGSGKSKKW